MAQVLAVAARQVPVPVATAALALAVDRPRPGTLAIGEDRCGCLQALHLTVDLDRVDLNVEPSSHGV